MKIKLRRGKIPSAPASSQTTAAPSPIDTFAPAGSAVSKPAPFLKRMLAPKVHTKRFGGDFYRGEMARGEPHGHGDYTWANGERYIGQWRNGHLHGHGKIYWANGNRYVGQWNQNRCHGRGEMYFADGSRYIGEFKAGKQNGSGVYHVANGYSYTGRWKDSTFVEEQRPEPPLVMAGFEEELQRLGDQGKSLLGWIRSPEGDMLVTHQTDPAEQPCAPAMLYEIMRTTFERRTTALTELVSRGRELVGAVAAPGGELALLVRCPVESQGDVTHDYVSRLFTRFPSLTTLDQGGQVVAYAYLPADPETGSRAQHLLIWDKAERAAHQMRVLAAADLRSQCLALPSDTWRVTACAGDAHGYTCVLQGREETCLQGPKAARGAAHRLLRAADFEAAATVLEGLCGDLPAAEELALRTLATALRQHAAAPWEAYRGLGVAMVQPPAGLDGECLRTCLEHCLSQDIWANRLSGVCAAMAQHPVDAATAQALAAAMLRACTISGPADAQAPMAAAIAARSVEATAFIATLGLVGPETRAEAEATGLPALVAAACGDLEGLRQWERLGPRARNSLQWAAQRAALQSQAATPKLVQRLTTLLGVSAAEVATLRRFIQQADVWVNFPGDTQNKLLESTTYQPDSTKRQDMERNRFAGHYHDGPLPREEFPKYGWLNTHKVRLGLQHYGDSALILQPHVQLRTNWVLRDDWSTNASAGTQVSMDHIILRLSDQVLRGLYAASRGEKLDRLQKILDVKRDFVEVQVHGPLDIQQDVRKVVAPTTALASGALALNRFAQRAQLPLRWRDAGAIEVTQRPRYVAALGDLDLSVAAWTSHADTDRLLLHPAQCGTMPAHYELHSAPAQELLGLINHVGRGQQEIVGLRLDPPNNQVNGRRPFATLLVRDAAQPVDYTLRRTAQLGARLRQMEANGLVVCAYAQEVQNATPLPLHVLVAKQAADGEGVEHMHLSTHKDRLDAVRATHVAAGWTVCGLASCDGKTFTLVLRRPTAPPAVQDDAGETTLISREPLATVPEPLRFYDDARHLYDVDELVELIVHTGVFKNFYTNQALSPAETQGLLNHPSGAGARLRSLQALHDSWRASISPAARSQILALAEQLAQEATTGPLVGSTQAVAAFQSFVVSCSPDEQAALYAGRFTLLDTHHQPFSLSVMEALSGLQRGAGCSRATANYLQMMMGELTGSRL